jgi:hypothetical protein
MYIIKVLVKKDWKVYSNGEGKPYTFTSEKEAVRQGNKTYYMPKDKFIVEAI